MRGKSLPIYKIFTEDGKEWKRDIKFTVTLKPQCFVVLGLLDENGDEKRVSHYIDYMTQGFIVGAPRLDMSDKTFLLHFSSDMDKASVETAINNAEKVLLDLDMDTAYLRENLTGINYIFTWRDAKTLQIQMNGLRESKYYPINLIGAKSVEGFTFHGFDNFWCFTATTDMELIHETQEMQKFYLDLDEQS